jgi:RNA polymerase sigma factor (sigma-70 family)
MTARLASSAILACQSDDRLVKLVRAGHERAFETIVDRYRKPLERYCRRILPESRCEDAVQQAFINAHAALGASDDAVQLKPWLYAITRNAALNMLRQNGWNYEQIPLDFDGVRRPDQVVEQRIELQQTVAAMNALPERQRDALVMREFEGRSYTEIAVALGAGDGAVRQLLNRARVTLRNAASLLIPPPMVARAAASLPPSDGRRMAEVLGGLGGAGMAKAGATALVAGSLVVGAVKAPLPSHKTTREKATLATDKPAAAPARPASAARDTTVALRSHTPVSNSHRKSSKQYKPATGDKQHRSVNSGPSHSGEREDSGSRERHRSGSDDTREHSGSDRDESTSDDHSGTSSGSDDDAIATLETEELSTSGTSGSGTSGESTSGSGTSGSDSSASGSSGSSSDGSTSGSDDPIPDSLDN